MGIAGAGNSGTVLAVLLAPPLATHYGWRTVYGFAALIMLIPMAIMVIFAKEPPDRAHQTLKEHLSCLYEKDGWVFNFIYIITFGGFIGLSNFLPTYFHDQFGVTKIQAGQLTMLAALMGSGIRIVGGHISDRIGGIRTLFVVFSVIIVGIILTGMQTSVAAATLLFMFCFAALGAGNGAVFQLVPLRWPATTAVVGSMIGEIGALGGGFVPNAMGLSKQYTGSYFSGFLAFACLAAGVFIVMRLAQRQWVKEWVAEGGRAKEAGGALSVEKFATAPATAGLFMKTIVYPVGNSDLQEKARGIIANLCQMSGAKLVLIYVADKVNEAAPVMTDSPAWEEIRQQWIVEGRELLQKEASHLQKMKVQNIETEIRVGQVAKEVCRSASERNADMIVVASHKQSPMGSLLMGERTFGIFKEAQCPILRIVR